jgi:protein TonB
MGFCGWLAVSLALHAIFILPFFFAGVHWQEQRKHKRLTIELFGMVSNRQVEEKKKGAAPVQPEKKVVRPNIVRQERKPAPKEQPKPAPAADNPAVAEKTEEKQNASGQQGIAVFVPAASGAGRDNADQRQQSIRYGERDSERDAIREYLARVAKKVNANVVYPAEVKKDGVEGIATISFTIAPSGAIKADSLRLQKSSGHAALDASALKSALAGAPFERPPREITPSIDVRFTSSTARSRTNRAFTR